MADFNEKTQVLIEALPYIKKYNEKIVVIKFGGNAMNEMEHLIEDIVLLKSIGMNPVVVHGGGPEVDAELKKLGITPKFIGGLRYTDENTMAIAEKVFNKINDSIVDSIAYHGAKSMNANGYIKVKQKSKKLGLVGDITSIDKNKLLSFIAADFIPVISPLGKDKDGEIYNINADTVASNIAVAVKAEKLTILTDVDGVRLNGKIVPHLNFKTAKDAIKSGLINEGMIPKVEACMHAVRNKCPKAHLINGLTPHSLLLEIFTDEGVGTEIVNRGKV